MSIFGATDTLFRTSGDVSSGFQSQSGFCLIQTLQRRTWYMFPVLVTPLPVYIASIAAGCFPRMRVSADIC